MNIFENPLISEQQFNSFVKDIVKANKGVPPPSPPTPPPPPTLPQPTGAPFSHKTFDPMVYKKLSDAAVKFGYNFTVENGQFRFGPPLSWKKDQPAPRKTEIFICQIPRSCPMLDLLLILFKIEKFFDFRMMFNFSNLNKGFAFCRFFKPSDAAKAISMLNAYEFHRDGQPFKLVVLPSEDKTMLSIYPLPTTVTLNQINQLLIKCEIDENSIKNIGKDENTFRRGVKWLITFDEHRSAALAKRKLMAFKNAWSTNFTVALHSSDQEKSSPQSTATTTATTATTTSAPPNRKALLPSPPPLILSLPRPLTSKKKKFPKSNGGSCFPPGQRNIVHSYRPGFDPSFKLPTKFDTFNPMTACGSSF